MKKYTFILLSCALLCYGTTRAQGIKITSGTTFKLTGGDLDMVLANGSNLENNAALQSNNLIVKATGTGNTQLKGTAPLNVGQIQVNKTTGQSLTLMKDVNVAGNVTFTSGLLDLNGNTLMMGDTANLVNESETSHIGGATGGAVQVQRNLDAPLAENPGNLGLVITSGANWGNTTIRRGHHIFTGPGGGSTIARSFVITPANNSNLNAFLRVYYKDEELNGLDENTLDFFQSNDNGVQWTNIGSASRNTTQNFVNINGVQSLSLLSLSTTNNPLPLLVTQLSASCEQDHALLQWRVATPQQIDFFRIMKSKDALVWEVAQEHLDAFPDAAHLYQFTDEKTPYAFYRLESVGMDGVVTYAPVSKVNCKEAASTFNLLQNPVGQVLQVNSDSKMERDASLQIFDAEGRLLMTKNLTLQSGNSRLEANVAALSAGMYYLRIMNHQALLWQAKFVKQ